MEYGYIQDFFCDESIAAVAEWLAYSIIYVIAMAC